MGSSSSCIDNSNRTTPAVAIGTGASRGTGRAGAMASREPAGSAASVSEVKVDPAVNDDRSNGGAGSAASDNCSAGGATKRRGSVNAQLPPQSPSPSSRTAEPQENGGTMKRPKKASEEEAEAKMDTDAARKIRGGASSDGGDGTVGGRNGGDGTPGSDNADDVTVSDLDIEVMELGGSKYRAAPKKPVLLKREVFDEFKTAVASVLHDEWRKPRLLPDGTYDPRPKDVAGTIYDIANLSFPELPHKFQVENAVAAEIACTFVVQSVAEHGRWIPQQLEEGSKQEHDAWMERNGSWAPPHQMLPYAELSTEEKQKDRAIILAAVDYLDRVYNKIIWADRSGKAPPEIDLSYLKTNGDKSATTTASS